MNLEARQRARERAADGVAPREQVIIRKYDWQPVPFRDAGVSAREANTRRRRRNRAAAKQRMAS